MSQIQCMKMKLSKPRKNANSLYFGCFKMILFSVEQSMEKNIIDNVGMHICVIRHDTILPGDFCAN